MKVSSGSADAEEVRGRMQLSGQALDFNSETVVGLRFRGVRIPQGAKITAAYIEFRAVAAGSGKLTLTVRGEDSADAGAFRDRRKDLSSRRETSTSSTWRPLAWKVGQTTRSSSLTRFVQETADRGDWRSGNAPGFGIRGSGGARRAAMSRDRGRTYAPTLVVSFGDSGSGSSFPFIDHFLMHPTTQFIRYNFYMYKLTGDSGYYAEARRLAQIVKGQMKTISTPRGVGYSWRHRVTGGGTLDCQPMVYVRYTTQAMADIATAESSLFNSTFMKRVANTMAYRALKNPNGTSLAGDICGGGTYGSVYTFAQHPYAQLAAWDGSGRLETAAERAYAATERWNLSSPTTSNVAAQMVFSLGR